MTTNIIRGGYVDIEVREQAVPTARIRASFAASGSIEARGGTDAKALAELAAEIRRIASAIDDLARLRSGESMPARTCQIEIPNWDGPTICENPLPCSRHGGR